MTNTASTPSNSDTRPDEGVTPVIYHVTPFTPRAALNAVMPGRAAGVSFYRPDDLEALLAICPQLFFRPRDILALDEGDEGGARMGRCAGIVVAEILSLAGADSVSSGAMGDHSRQPRCTFPAQRRLAERLAVRGSRGAGLAHGRPCRTTSAALREISARVHRVDRRPEERTGWLPGLSPQDGASRATDGECVASAAHASWDSCCVPVSLYQRGQHQPRAERSPL